MKLAIEISKDAYELCKKGFFVNSGMRSGKTFMSAILKAIANGEPIPQPTCIDCALCDTDACPRGAGRTVDSEICKDFLQGV